MKTIRLMAALLFCLLLSGTAEAKWWIFGQANDEVSISYLYLNNIQYEGGDQKISLYRQLLVNDEIILRGKARVGKGSVGSVRVSVDNRERWQEAKLAADGAFEFRFQPETGKTYVIYLEVSDTAGKVNDVEATRKEVTVVEGTLQQQVREVLDAMIAAYRSEDPRTFMAYVNEDFVSDRAVLDKAIRQDFSLFDNIDLRYTLNSVASGQGGVQVAISFSRSLTSAKSGKTLSDHGSTDFVFKPGERGLQVFSMRNPLIFGLSDQEEVATGTVNDGSNPDVIVVTAGGDITTVPLDRIGDDSSAGDTVESGYNIAMVSHHAIGFDFAAGEVLDLGNGDFVLTGVNAETPPLYGYAWLKSGVSMVDLGSEHLSAVSEAPASGYSDYLGQPVYLYVGHVFAFRLASGKYALMEVKSVSVSYGEQMVSTMVIDYKYQGNGSRLF